MPHRPGEICEHCKKHVHPLSEASKEVISSHPPPACNLCLPLNHTLKTCNRCKLTRYCGKDCQVAHWPTHKIYCKSQVGIHNMAKKLGKVTEAMHTSYCRWCEDNFQAIGKAARNALGIRSQLDRERLHNYAFLITIATRDITAVGSKKLTFAHSILTARQVSMQEMHRIYDWRYVGNPGGLERNLSPTPGLMRVLVENTTLPHPMDLYSLPGHLDKHPGTYDPQWLTHLKEEVNS